LPREHSSAHGSACITLQNSSHFAAIIAATEYRYGCLSKASDEFVFYPEWFLEPLQTALDFQTGVAQTQMFVDYVHKVI
jgi:hypothetical protein